MVSIFTGLGAGFERGSATTLGSSGLLGSGSLGRNNQQVSLNAATGNLLIGQRDEFLVGLGPDSAIGRTYNSLEDVGDGDNSDHWRQGTTRGIHGLTGTLNTVGSTVKRTSGDGSDITYTWNATASAYVATDGDGAYDKLVYTGGVWTWTDGSSQFTEKYAAHGVYGLTGTVNTTGSTITRIKADGTSSTYTWDSATSKYIVDAGTASTDNLTYAGGVWTWSNSGVPLTQYYYNNGANWRITELANTIGQKLSFTYAGAVLDKVTTQDGSYEQYSWSGGHITQILTNYTNLVTGTANQTLTRTRYGYDAYNRLTTVTVDLSPGDNVIADGKTYVTTYTYKSATAGTPGFTQVATIAQTDGSSISVDYDGSGRVIKFTQAVAGSVTRETSIAYGAGSTTITDPLMQVTTLEYNADGSLKKVTAPPPYSGAAAQVVQFSYDGSGNVLTATDALGVASIFTYDTSGNMLTSTDRLGNVVTRTYSAKNELLTETRAGSDASGAAVTHTTRYAYGTDGLPSYTVSAEGMVTLYQYVTSDEPSIVRVFNETYDVSALAPSQAIPETTLDAWQGAIADKTTTIIKNYARDARGNIVAIRSSSAATSTGAIDSSQPYGLTTYVYDQAGQLLSRTTTGLGTETFVYDGLGRITASTDLNGNTTSFAFNDSAMQTVVTLTNGYVQTSVYNKAGELISFTDSGSNVTGGTTYHAYDQRGQLRITTDATNHNSYVVYDKTGRKVADVDHYGNLIEYRYDANDLLATTIRYATAITSTQLTTLQNPLSNVEMSTLRPSAAATDMWTWTVYDAEGRVVEAINGDGGVTTYQYDRESRLVGTVTYYNKLTSTQITTIKTTPPTSPVLPTASSANDSVARTFYNKSGQLIGVLDGEGYLSRITYDIAGRKVAETAFATITTAGLRATGSFNALVTSVTTVANPADRIMRYVYDGQGYLRFQIDGLNQVTEYVYGSAVAGGAIGVVRQTIQYAGTIGALSDYKLATVKTAVAALASNPDNRKSWTVYDTSNRLVFSIDATGAVTGFSYDNLGRVTKSVRFATTRSTATLPDLATMTSWQTANASATTDRVTRNYYTARGELRYAVDAEGYVTRFDYDAEGRTIGTARWDTAITASDSTTIANVATLATGTYATTATSYDMDGRVATRTDGEGVVTGYVYNANGTLLWTTVATGTSDEAKTVYEYDNAGRVVTRYDAYGTAEVAITRFTYDGFGNVLTVTDPAAAVTTRTYDRLGQVLSETNPLSGAVAYQYNAFGEAVKATDERGNVSFSYYDNLGRVTLSYDAGQYGTQSSYTVFGELASVKRWYNRANNAGSVTLTTQPTFTADAARDATTSFLYDKVGRLLGSTDALGAVVSYTLNAFGEIETEVDPVESSPATTIQTTRTYDRRGLLKTQVVDSAGGGKSLTTTYGYDAFGRVVSLTNPASRVTTSSYDRNGRLKTLVDALSHTTTYSYDKRGNLAAVQDVMSQITRYTYDGNDRLIYTVDALGGVTQNSYDADGRVILSKAYASAISLAGLATIATTAAITAALAARVAPLSNDQLTRSVYDANGQLRFSVDAANFLTEVVYDAAGNAIRSITYSTAIASAPTYTMATIATQIGLMSGGAITASPVTRNVYNADNQRSFTIDALGNVTAYTYDTQGNVVKQQRVAANYATAGDPTDAAMATWLSSNGNTTNDRISRAIYDQNGQLRFDVDAEGYVTQYTYNAAGSVRTTIRYADRFNGTGGFAAFTDTTTLAQAITNVAATPTAPAAVTEFKYDSAGRLTETVDPEGTRTVMTLNQLGQALSTAVAYGTPDESVTTNSYDALGRVLTETRGYGQAETTTTTYRYDSLGRVLGMLGGNGSAALVALGGSPTQTQIDSVYATYGTIYTYDAVSNVLTTTVALTASTTATTTNSYDAFGNLVKIVDPRGNSGYFYYDAHNQLVLQVDPEGYATATSYTFTGQTASVTRYAVKPTGTPAIGAPPTIVSTPASDAVSTFTYDKLDRVLTTAQVVDTTPSHNITESYGYNAFGDRTTVTNKLGGLTTNSFDKRGLLLSEVIQVAVGSTITNTYAYDARGNLTQMVEASGAAKPRTTGYAYDKLDRLTTTTHDQVTVSAADLSSTSLVTPVDVLTYDRRGNVIKSVTAQVGGSGGAATWSYYDDADRKIAEIDALGTMSKWTYDANGNTLTATVYGDAVTPTGPGGTPPAPVSPTNARTTTYAYDRNNRLTTTTGPAIKMGSYNGTSYVVTTDAAVATNEYDAAGNIVTQTDGRGNKTWSFYNKIGQQLAQVDQENYLTTWVRDANGNVTSETRYANKITGAFTATSTVAALQTLAGTNATSDRTTTFTYDLAARRLTETRLSVADASVSGTGALTTGTENSQIIYTYNGFGEVLTKREANGDTTTYTYDKIGRTLTQSDPSYDNQNALTVTRRTTYVYDGLNNLLSSTVSDLVGNSGGEQHVTSYSYAVGGRLATMTDASGFARTYAYDAAGRTISESYSRLQSDGTSVIEAVAYTYDVAGRVTSQTNGRFNGSAWVFTDSYGVAYGKNWISYNAYGEMAARGTTAATAVAPAYQETFSYDANGQLWSTNSGDGVLKFFVYDKSGNQTLTLTSAGADLSALTAANYTASLTSTGDTATAAAITTVTVYDKRNQAIETRQPDRHLAVGGSSTLIVAARTYNAFGETASDTDARGFTTTYAYNTMGRLVTKVSPQVSVRAENGSLSNASPTETYAYDVSGRLIATTDARAYVTTRLLLAGSGHGDDEALVVKEFHPDGGVFETKYDVFGNARVLRNELYYGSNATASDELHVYDNLGRLITVTNRGALLTDSYSYDGLGQRLGHVQSWSGGSQTERTDYDAQGRIVRQIAFNGDTTGTAYVWSPTLTARNGSSVAIAAAGGWIETTTYANGRSGTKSTDVFGHVTSKTDLGDYGGHTSSYTYDFAGHMLGSAIGSDSIGYAWLDTGMVGTITNVTGGVTTIQNSSYDVAGNKLTEYQTRGGAVIENATATYDALNRLSTWSEAGNATTQSADTTYQYDANSNIMYAGGLNRYLNADGSVSIYQAAHGDTYLYDSMNRMVNSNGELITYNAAGQRMTVTTYSNALVWTGWRATEPGSGQTVFCDDPSEYDWQGYHWVHSGKTTFSGAVIEHYSYTADGHIDQVMVQSEQASANGSGWVNPNGVMSAAVLRADFAYDAQGRVSSQTDYEINGTSVAYSRWNIVYNAAGQVLSEANATNQTTGNFTNYITNTYGSGSTYALGAILTTSVDTWKDGSDSAIPDTLTTNSYSWYDGAVLTGISYKPDTGSSTTFTTTITPTASGQAASVSIVDGRPRSVSFVNDVYGQTIRRDEADSNNSQGDPHQIWYRFNGREMGSISNDGTYYVDYASSIADRKNTTTGTGAFRFGQSYGAATADFGDPYHAVNSFSQGGVGGSYTVQEAGETLASIAAQLWGDGNLWYKLAGANGLSANSQLTVGQQLSIPSGVLRSSNTAETFKPYDPAEALGNTSPTTPKPQKKANNCGVFGQILLIAISAVIMAVLPGPGGILGQALFGAAVNLGTQGVGVALGIQDNINWKGVALAGIASGVTAGLGSTGAIAGSAFLGDVVTAGIANAATQGISIAVGLQHKFSFAGLAGAAIGAGIGGGVARHFAQTGASTPLASLGQRLATSAAAGISNAAARSLVSGTNFGDNLMAALPDVIGQTAGGFFADVVSGNLPKPVRSARSGTEGSGGAPIGQAAADSGSKAQPGIIVTTNGNWILNIATATTDESVAFFDHTLHLPDEIPNPSISLEKNIAAQIDYYITTEGGAETEARYLSGSNFKPGTTHQKNEKRIVKGEGSWVDSVVSPDMNDFGYLSQLSYLHYLKKQYTPDQMMDAGKTTAVSRGLTSAADFEVYADRVIASAREEGSQQSLFRLRGATGIVGMWSAIDGSEGVGFGRVYAKLSAEIARVDKEGDVLAADADRLGQAGLAVMALPLTVETGFAAYGATGLRAFFGWTAFGVGTNREVGNLQAPFTGSDPDWTPLGSAIGNKNVHYVEIGTAVAGVAVGAREGAKAFVQWRTTQKSAQAVAINERAINLLSPTNAQYTFKAPALAAESLPAYNVSTAGMTVAERQAVVEYAQRSNVWLAENGGTTVQSTAGTLRSQANAAARTERLNAARAGTSYQGQAGHVPDTALTGTAQPPAGWLDMPGRSNSVVGGGLSSRIGKPVSVITVDGRVP